MARTVPENQITIEEIQRELSRRGASDTKIAQALQYFNSLSESGKELLKEASPLAYGFFAVAAVGSRLLNVPYEYTAYAVAGALVAWIEGIASGKMTG